MIPINYLGISPLTPELVNLIQTPFEVFHFPKYPSFC